MQSLADNPRYNKFVKDRNEALEDLYLKAMRSISDAMGVSIENVTIVIYGRYEKIKAEGVYSAAGRNLMDKLQADIERLLLPVTMVVEEEMKRLRRSAYLLTYTSEAEAIGQALDEEKKYTLPKDKIKDKEGEDTFTGGTIGNRVQYAMNKLIRKILTAVELSVVNESTQEELEDRLFQVLPKKRKTRGMRKKIASVKESASRNLGMDMSTGYLDDETWDEMVDIYKSEYVPRWRGPEHVAFTLDRDGEEEEIYQWEVEQEVTQDFVYQVRQGQIDAAEENGITDYVWVAIVDSRTDDCCLWRDGLTTEEIERELKGKRRNDRCQAITPPAHFNCRCVLAPMVREMPDRPKSNVKDFETWLNT